MLLAKRTGGSTIHGHHWEHDDAAVDVPYDLAVELLGIKGADFYVPEAEVPELSESPKPRTKKQDAPPPEEKPAAAASAAPAPPAVKPAAGK